MFNFPAGQAVAFCATFLVGAVGYFLFRFLRIPNPALLGSMAATGALNAAGFYPPFSTSLLSFAANVVIGVTIGRQINRAVIGRMTRMLKPVLIQTSCILVLSLACGFVMNLTSGVDLTTSLISGTAGGITEMVVFGMSIDADVSVIAFVQLFRIVIFISVIPYVIIIAEKFIGESRTTRIQNDRAQNVLAKFFEWRHYIGMVPLAFAAGAIASWLNVPTGAMLGAMFAGGGMALLLGRQYKFDDRLRITAQIGLGLVTGERITPQFIEQLASLFMPVLGVSLVMLTGCILLALLLYKTSEWSLATCLLCAAPAGLSQIASFAEDVGADPLVAAVFHTARIIGIVTFYPWLILPFTR